MAKRRKSKRTYKYECTLSGEEFITNEEAQNPDDLVSVSSYYEMNPEKDDRPAFVKKKLGVSEDSE